MAILISIAEAAKTAQPISHPTARHRSVLANAKAGNLSRRWLSRHFALGIALTIACAVAVHGQASVGEYEVKAAFLFNFAKFVEWPPAAFSNATDPVRLCVFGEDPFDHSLERVVDGKTANGRAMQVLHVHSIKDVKGCHILFISWAEEKQTDALLQATRGAGILTVGETDNFARDGGVLNFVLQQNRVAFEINVDAAEQNNLKISSRLLSLARIVHSPGRN